MIGFDENRELEISKLTDSRLICINPTAKGFYDNVLNFLPDWKKIQSFKEAVKQIKNAQLPPFWRPIMDPSIQGGKVIFKKGCIPAVDISCNSWQEIVSKMPPVEGKRWKLGTDYQYYTFLCWIINQQIKRNKWSVERAINNVFDLKEVEYLGYSPNKTHVNFEVALTGCGEEVCGFYDLHNTYKILSSDNKNVEFWRAGIDKFNYQHDLYVSLAELKPTYGKEANLKFSSSVGWLVLS
ncbi:MAG: hypothetical protein IJK18_00710 [Clostridia bacterium]|nr:hypothetical protein [Clostridia bacterium]